MALPFREATGLFVGPLVTILGSDETASRNL
jgi:hypothetical protein